MSDRVELDKGSAASWGACFPQLGASDCLHQCALPNDHLRTLRGRRRILLQYTFKLGLPFFHFFGAFKLLVQSNEAFRGA